MITATIVATGTITAGLTSHLLNPVMAQSNSTKGNSTAENMTGGEKITSTSPAGICQPCCGTNTPNHVPMC
ncbi:MAG: hypothetical protein M3Z01_00845 [Thermoproteota archaeon]|nr:hypothetical protein [Thermoproteota archaeon]